MNPLTYHIQNYSGTDHSPSSLTPELQAAANTPKASIGARLRQQTLATYLLLGGAAVGAGSMQSCTPTEQVKPTDDPNKLTADEIAFAELLKPHPDGRLKYAILEGGVEPYVFKNFARVDLELINAKGKEYKATPWIQKKSVAEVIAKAKELNPGQEIYGISLSLVRKFPVGELVLNTTEFITDKDDNNPSTKAPWLDVLPEEFTLDEFVKYQPNSTMKKSYTLNAGEELVVRMAIAGESAWFSDFKFGLDPVKKVN